MEEFFNSNSASVHSKSKKVGQAVAKRKSSTTEGVEADVSKPKVKGEKRTRKRKSSDLSKKSKKEETAEVKSTSTSQNSSITPDSEQLRHDQSDSPITDDVYEGSNSSQESNEMLSMSSLLKSVLDQKKKQLLESDEIQQFLKILVAQQEQCEGVSN